MYFYIYVYVPKEIILKIPVCFPRYFCILSHITNFRVKGQIIEGVGGVEGVQEKG